MNQTIKDVSVWNLYIRLSHWLMVLLFSGLIITGKAEEDYMQWHFYMGYLLSALLIARVLYGFWGISVAQFKHFIKGPVGLFQYAKQLISGRKPIYLGHNPLGGVMVIVLLILLLAQVMTGLVSSDDVFWFGPLYEWVSDDLQTNMAWWHKLSPDILLGLISCHILAVMVHEFALKERLLKAMVTGKKQSSVGKIEDAYLFKSDSSRSVPKQGVRFLLILSVSFIWLLWLWQLPI